MKNYKIMNNAKKQTSPRQMTEEKRKEQITRAFMKKRASLVEGILFNLCQRTLLLGKPERIVEKSIEMADQMMQKLFGMKAEQ